MIVYPHRNDCTERGWEFLVNWAWWETVSKRQLTSLSSFTLHAHAELDHPLSQWVIRNCSKQEKEFMSITSLWFCGIQPRAAWRNNWSKNKSRLASVQHANLPYQEWGRYLMSLGNDRVFMLYLLHSLSAEEAVVHCSPVFLNVRIYCPKPQEVNETQIPCGHAACVCI